MKTKSIAVSASISFLLCVLMANIAGALTCVTVVVTAYPSGGGSGSVVPSRSAGCAAGTYTPGALVNVVATPNSGYIFGGWSGVFSSDQPIFAFNVPQTQTQEVATFIPYYSLELNVSPTGGGSVGASPSASGAPAGSYIAGDPITITASPNPGWYFAGWSGDVVNSTNAAVNFTMPAQEAAATATFVPLSNSVSGFYLISGVTQGNTNIVGAYGTANYSYILERSTNLAPDTWVDISTNIAATNGLINASDSFWDLGGVPPASAYYRLKYQPQGN